LYCILTKIQDIKIMLTQFRCKKCDHEWIPRINGIPKVCPKCKHYDWQESEKPGASQLVADTAPKLPADGDTNQEAIECTPG
jgi:uncharacterized Zn ribbon protein